MGRRRQYNEDTNCGCKFCRRLIELETSIWCSTCKACVEVPCKGKRPTDDEREAARKLHEGAGMHTGNKERAVLRSMFGENWIETRIHAYGVSTERIKARGFSYFSPVFDAWYGEPYAEYKRIVSTAHRYLSGEQANVVSPLLFNSDEAWTMAHIMCEEQDTSEARDMWLDFYLKVKRGEYK